MSTRSTPPQGIQLIKRWEGLRLDMYKDVAGYPTIGYGHLVLPHEKFGGAITEAEAEALLRRDLKRYERSVGRLVHVPLSDNQYSALVSFTFNLGGAALQRSTLRMKLNREDYLGAADELHRWVYAGGRKVRGLMRRRSAERALFLRPVLLEGMY